MGRFFRGIGDSRGTLRLSPGAFYVVFYSNRIILRTDPSNSILHIIRDFSHVATAYFLHLISYLNLHRQCLLFENIGAC